MLDLPETLLLFGLHDDRGTVHSAAFLALDHGLRGAIIAELRLRGRVRTSRDGRVRRIDNKWSRLDSPVLDRAMGVLAAAPSPGSVTAWLKALESGMPDLRQALISGLESRGILGEISQDRPMLPNTVAHPMEESGPEESWKQRVRDAATATDPPPPRVGTLLALVGTVHLDDVVYPAAIRESAQRWSTWVHARDGVVRAVEEVVARTEGTWLDQYEAPSPEN